MSITPSLLEQIELNANINGKLEKLTSLNLGLTVYFPIPFSSCQESLGRLLKIYFDKISISNFKFQNFSGTTKGYKKIAPSTLKNIGLIERKDNASSYCMWLKSGNSTTDTSEYLLDLFAREKETRPFDSNYLRLLFPFDILEQYGSKEFVKWVGEMLYEFPYYSAYAGYTVGTSSLLQVSPYSNLINEKLYSISERFIGVRIEKPHLENYEMKKYVRSPGWLTFLSNDNLNYIGGARSLQKHLKGDFEFIKTKFGMSIQSGALPQIGDKIKEENSLIEQRALARFLEPLYSPNPAKLFSNKGSEHTLAWHRGLL